MILSIIIPTKDNVDLLESCINSIVEVTNWNYNLGKKIYIEIIIVNNESQTEVAKSYFKEVNDGRLCKIESCASTIKELIVKVVGYNNSFNYSSINNSASFNSEGEYLLLLNNDTKIISANWLFKMVELVSKDYVGCVGAKLYYHDDTIQHAGLVLGINHIAGHVYKNCPGNYSGYSNHLTNVRQVSAVTGACLLVKKSIYQEVGGMDENLAVAYNDVDFCLKVQQAGYKNFWTPHAELYHYESKSRPTHQQRSKNDKKRFKAEVDYMKKKWGKTLAFDPHWPAGLPLTEQWCWQS